MKILDCIVVAWFPAPTKLLGSVILQRDFLKQVPAESEKASAKWDHRCHLEQPRVFTDENIKAVQLRHPPQFPSPQSTSTIKLQLMLFCWKSGHGRKPLGSKKQKNVSKIYDKLGRRNQAKRARGFGGCLPLTLPTPKTNTRSTRQGEWAAWPPGYQPTLTAGQRRSSKEAPRTSGGGKLALPEENTMWFKKRARF